MTFSILNVNVFAEREILLKGYKGSNTAVLAPISGSSGNRVML